MRPEQVVFPVLRAVVNQDWSARLADKVLRPWNPFSPDRYIDPYPLYEKVRAAGPVNYQASFRTWNVAGYDECEALLRAPTTSVNRSELLNLVSPYKKLQPSTLGLFTSTMLLIDPPDHGRLRSLVSRAFTPRRMAKLEPQVEKITRSLLHEIGEQSTTDAMETFANRLPVNVISAMLGLPETQWEALGRISDVLAKFVDPITGFTIAEMEATVGEFRGLLRALIDQRLEQPQDDMLSDLLAAEDDGDQLSRSELESMAALLMVAGHETTAGLIGNSLVALDRHRTARSQLLEEPEIAANAVEELLRFDTPVQGTDRAATADFELGGHTVKEGHMAVALLGAANRDPRRYERPNELILDRKDPRPLSFGNGAHYCLGAALARLEARVALPLFLQEFPDYRVDEDRLTWKRSVTLRGPSQLPLRLR